MPTHLNVLCSIPPLFHYTIIENGKLEFRGFEFNKIFVSARKAWGNGGKYERWDVYIKKPTTLKYRVDDRRNPVIKKLEKAF